MGTKNLARQGSVAAAALMIASAALSGCSSASGSSGNDGVYINTGSGTKLILVDGDSVVSATNRNSGDACRYYITMLERAEKGDLDADYVKAYDGQKGDVATGTVTKEQSTVVWGADTVQPFAFNTPLDGSITTDEPATTHGQKGIVFVPVDSDQAKLIIADRRTRTC